MTKGIRRSFRSVFTYAGLAIAAIAAMMLIEFSPAVPRQNVPLTNWAASGLPRAGKQALSATASPTHQLAANYGKLPLGFEPNEGQSDGRVKFLSRGRGYSLFLTGDEAVLTFQRASQRTKAKEGEAPNLGPARANLAQSLVPSTALLPNPLTLSMSRERGESEADKPWDRRPSPALPLSSPRRADRSKDSAVLRMRLVGANPSAAVMGREKLPGKSNYFIGNDSKKWHTNVPTFAKVNYQNVYPGVDLVYYGSQGGQLEYDFVLAPGADPAAIRLGLSGGLREESRQSAAGSGTQNQPTSQSKIQNVVSKIDLSGDLVVKIAGGEVRFHKPVIYQPAIADAHRTSDSGLRTAVEGHYVLRAGNQVGFEVAPYDHSRPLVIDPVLSYSTFLDGNQTDYLRGIAVDSSGNAYVTGFTNAADFPTTSGALQTAPPDGNFLAYVSKFDPTGTSLVYSTFLGGTSSGAQGYAIAVDRSGNAYIAGAAEAPFPTTAGAYQTTITGAGANFVTKLNPTGSALVYSTWIGTGDIYNIYMAVNSAGNAFLTGTYYAGSASSAPPPITGGAFQTNPSSCAGNISVCPNVFVAQLNAAGSALVYCTYLGGSGGTGTYGYSIAADSSGSAYVTGITYSASFPTMNPIQATNKSGGGGGYGTGFVTKFNPAGSALVYSTYLGGSNYDGGYGIAVDSSGNAYVTGYTGSTDFPTVKPLQSACGGCSKGINTAFVTKLNPAGSALVYSTYLGGSGGDYGSAIAVDSAGEAYVAGETESTNFPTVNPFQATNKGGYFGIDLFVAQLNAAGSELVSSSYLGGTQDDYVSGIGVDSTGNAYVAGQTFSTNFPTTSEAFQQTATAAPCLHFPPGYIPFTSFITVESGTGGEVLFGQMTPAAFEAMSSVPLPNEPFRQSFCESVELYPGSYWTVAVPTAQERQGDFADVGFQLTNPLTSQAYVNDIITPPASPSSPFPWVLNGVSAPAGNNDYVAKISLNSEVSPSAASLPFGTQDVGVPSSALTETVTNSGTDILTVSKATIAGADPGDFATSADTCTGATIKPTDTCTVNVTFTPTASGSRSASLEFIDNASNSPQTVDLTGTGISYIAVTLGPTAASLPLSHTEVFTATITGTANLGLIWSVNGVVNGNAAQGTITGCTTVAPWSCTYTAPPVNVPSPNPAVIKVASAADSAIYKTASVTVTDDITVLVIPANARVALGGRSHLTSILGHTTNTRRSWYVNGVLNGNAAQGKLSGCTAISCNYTAPPVTVPSPNPVVIRVVSAADPTKSGTAKITVTGP